MLRTRDLLPSYFSLSLHHGLLKKFGEVNDELVAAMQGWNCMDDLARRDLLLDIGTEELSHLEVGPGERRAAFRASEKKALS